MIKSFKIIKFFSNICQFEFSKSMKIHDIFHISFLKLAIADFLFEQIQSSSSSIMINEENEYEIEKILNSKLLKNKLHYKIKWKNYLSNDKWYSVDNFENSQNLIANFHVKNSAKLKFLIKATIFNYKKASLKTIKKKSFFKQ